MIGATEIQWEVIWFPPGGDRRKTGTESFCRKIFDQEKEMGNAPMLCNREVIVKDWKIVENSV